MTATNSLVEENLHVIFVLYTIIPMMEQRMPLEKINRNDYRKLVKNQEDKTETKKKKGWINTVWLKTNLDC